MKDIFLESDFTEEQESFVFKGHDNAQKDYIVRVSFVDIASFLGIDVSEINIETIRHNTGNEVFDVCRGIVHLFQTTATDYKVKIEPIKQSTKFDDQLAEAYQKGYNEGAEAAANDILRRV